MKYLKIQNKGELDIRLISLMGGSTKTGDTTKIGRFGTGLKYTLAYLIRNNIDFKVFVGKKQIKFTTKIETIQDHEFEILYIDGQRSSITSSMGVDWEGWMIVREIWCNALDEGNELLDETHELNGKKGTTTFYLQLTGDIKTTKDNWQEYFIHDVDPIFENNDYGVYPPSQEMRIYKNGVLIEKEKGSKSVFSYDIKNADINELREYKGYKTLDIYNALRVLDKKGAEYFLNNLNEKHYEYNMDYDWGSNMEVGWKEAIGDAQIIAREDMKAFKAKGVDIDEDLYIQVSRPLFKKLSNNFKGVSGVRKAGKLGSFHEIKDDKLTQHIKEGLAILEACDYYIDPELTWITGVFGNPMVLAKINIDEKVIMFSQELVRKSLFDLCSTIVEENEHYKTGFSDHTREFQQHFIDLYTKGMLTLNEVKL